MPLTTKLEALHDVIHAAFGWKGYHLHLFEVGEERYGVPAPEWGSIHPIPSEKTMRPAALIERGIKLFSYTYDFRDDWRQEIVVEAVGADILGRSTPTSYLPRGVPRPRMSAACRARRNLFKRSPGRATGGHKAMLAWHGGPYDPDHIGEAEIIAVLGQAGSTANAQSNLS